MGYHTVLYRGANAGGGATGAINIVPAPFDNVSATNTYLPPFDMDILGAAAASATLTFARIQTALLLSTASLNIWPFSGAATFASNYNWSDFTRFPVQIRRNENINVAIATSGAGETGQVIIHLGDRNYSPPPMGRRMRIRMTGATTLGVAAWTNVPLTPDESLPDAMFYVTAFSAFSATGIASRLAFPGYAVNGVTLCPGVPTLQAVTGRQPYPMMDGRFGVIGKFRNTTLPQLQQFSTAADTAQQVFMDVIRVDE